MREAEFRDPRLVEVYDVECAWGPDDDWFRSSVGPPPARVLDLGCGTGRVTVALALDGHAVTGIDPAPAALAAARRKAGAERVSWIEGTSADAPGAAFDAAVMSSHVAQLFVTDDDWARTSEDLARAVVPGGRLAFDTRDPAAEAWMRWNPTDWSRAHDLADGRRVDVETEVTGVEGGVVDLHHTYRFSDGTTLRSDLTLRFRTMDEVAAGIEPAGFVIERVDGPPDDWWVLARRR